VSEYDALVLSKMPFVDENISGAHGILVHIVHILTLIYQSQIQRYSYMLGKTPLSSWLGTFTNYPMSPHLFNIVGSQIDESDLICAPNMFSL
jgi:hypothetical protein